MALAAAAPVSLNVNEHANMKQVVTSAARDLNLFRPGTSAGWSRRLTAFGATSVSRFFFESNC